MKPMIALISTTPRMTPVIDPVLQRRGDRGRPEQHIDQHVVELQREARPRPAPPGRTQLVRPVIGQPAFRLGFGQPVRAGLEALERAGGGQRVPLRLGG
jgi:hypothetical protein